jgi:rhodanese-related sulfurtransferase
MNPNNTINVNPCHPPVSTDNSPVYCNNYPKRAFADSPTEINSINSSSLPQLHTNLSSTPSPYTLTDETIINYTDSNILTTSRSSPTQFIGSLVNSALFTRPRAQIFLRQQAEHSKDSNEIIKTDDQSTVEANVLKVDSNSGSKIDNSPQLSQSMGNFSLVSPRTAPVSTSPLTLSLTHSLVGMSPIPGIKSNKVGVTNFVTPSRRSKSQFSFSTVNTANLCSGHFITDSPIDLPPTPQSNIKFPVPSALTNSLPFQTTSITNTGTKRGVRRTRDFQHGLSSTVKRSLTAQSIGDHAEYNQEIFNINENSAAETDKDKNVEMSSVPPPRPLHVSLRAASCTTASTSRAGAFSPNINESPCSSPTADPSLFADYTPLLPSVKMSGGIQTISIDQVAEIVKGSNPKINCLYEAVHIIDCRFPYEYIGGHIRGAVNVNTYAQLQSLFFVKPDNAVNPSTDQVIPLCTPQLQSVRTLIIFHCEFSKSRGPKALLYLRSLDRELVGISNFPSLYYPEVYLMRAGYNKFHSSYSSLCEPEGYVAMESSEHQKELQLHWKQMKINNKNNSATKKAFSYTQNNPMQTHAANVSTNEVLSSSSGSSNNNNIFCPASDITPS